MVVFGRRVFKFVYVQNAALPATGMGASDSSVLSNVTAVQRLRAVTAGISQYNPIQLQKSGQSDFVK